MVCPQIYTHDGFDKLAQHVFVDFTQYQWAHNKYTHQQYKVLQWKLIFIWVSNSACGRVEYIFSFFVEGKLSLLILCWNVQV